MRHLLLLFAIACGEVHFVEPNPPQLFRSQAQYTGSAVSEPLVWMAILDLFIEDADACAWARQTTLDTVRATVAGVGGDQFEIAAQDLAPDCRLRGTQALDVGAVAQALSIAEASFPGRHLRPVYVYVDNVDLALPSALLQAFTTLRAQSTLPGLLLTVSLAALATQLAAFSAVPWTYAGDPALAQRLGAAVEQALPLQSTATTTTGPVALLDSAQVETTREFKVCALPGIGTVENPPDVGVAQIVDRSNPPTITFDLPQAIALPKSGFHTVTISIPVEGCTAHCDRYYIAEAGDDPHRWDEMKRCALEAR